MVVGNGDGDCCGVELEEVLRNFPSDYDLQETQKKERRQGRERTESVGIKISIAHEVR